MASSLELFVCDKCPKSFATRSRYNQHCKTHSKPHSCVSCDKSFALRLDLTRHVQARHRVGLKQFPCQISNCHFRTKRTDNLKQHLRKRHAIIDSRMRADMNRREEECPKGTRQDINQMTLCEVAGAGNVQLLRHLIDQGADITMKADDWSTPLHCAARAGSTDALVLLLERGASMSARNKKSRTALSEAAVEGHVEAVKIMLDRGADGRSIFSYSISSGKDQITQLLIDDLGAEVLYNSFTPLHLAAKEGNIYALRQLLSHPKVDPSLTCELGWTPLHHAAARGHGRAVDVLLEVTAVDVNASEREGYTPLQVAVRFGHEEVVERLLSCETINVNATNRKLRTAIHVAAEFKNTAAARLLLGDRRLDMACMFKIRHTYGTPPLVLAVRSGSHEVVGLLFQHTKVFPDMEADDGSTVLSLASQIGNAKIVELLLAQKNINVEKRAWWLQSGPRSMTALQIARRRGHMDIVNMLLAYGAIDLDDGSHDPSSKTSEALSVKLLNAGSKEELGQAAEIVLDNDLGDYLDDYEVDFDMDLDLAFREMERNRNRFCSSVEL